MSASFSKVLVLGDEAETLSTLARMSAAAKHTLLINISEGGA